MVEEIAEGFKEREFWCCLEDGIPVLFQLIAGRYTCKIMGGIYEHWNLDGTSSKGDLMKMLLFTKADTSDKSFEIYRNKFLEKYSD
jgi:hypothetical protein